MSTKNFPLSQQVNLSCRLDSGSLTVRAEPNCSTARVTMTAREPDSDAVERSTVELRESTLVVHGPKNYESGRRNRDAMDVEVTVPAGTPMKLTAVSADVEIHGSAGPLDISSGSADVNVEQVQGALRLRGGSGDIEVGLVSGEANIKGGSGQIRIGEAAEALQVGAGSGDIELGVARGPVRLRSGSGSVAIGVIEHDADLISGSGNLAVGLRAGQPARLDVLTGSGRFESDMPVETTPPADGPAINIRARTGSGDVRIRRVPGDDRLAG